jgi:hypothetical protein
MKTQLTTSQEAHEAAKKIWQETGELVARLCSRWLDERGYENLNDYQTVLAPEIAKRGGELISMISRPFGYRFKVGIYFYVAKMTAGGKYTLARVAQA